MKSKFDFHEIVTVSSKKDNLREIYNKKAIIRGKAIEDGQEWYYTICILETGRCWCATESALESTGEFEPPESEPRPSVRVGVTKDGVGYLIDPESANDGM